MKILHMADCHLDSAMETSLPSSVAASRRKELLLTFKDIIKAAENGGVRLVLIAGDLFDTATPSRSLLTQVLAEFSAYPSIDFILIEGNHDADALKGRELPKNVFLVKAGESRAFHYGDVSVYALGYGVTEENILAFPMLTHEKNILLMHGTVGIPHPDHPEMISRTALEKCPTDYLALGHYHSHRAEKIGARCTACYAGIPEGRGFDETGICGVVLLETDTMHCEFIPSARRTLHNIRADISSAQNQHDIENIVHSHINDLPAKDMVRLTLCGHFRESVQKDMGLLKAMLDSRFYFYRLKDESRLALSPEDYKNDLSLRGEFVRRVFSANLSDEDRNRILAYGLRALYGEEIEED